MRSSCFSAETASKSETTCSARRVVNCRQHIVYFDVLSRLPMRRFGWLCLRKVVHELVVKCWHVMIFIDYLIVKCGGDCPPHLFLEL